VEQARHAMEKEAARVTAIAPRRRGPASTENGQRSRDRVLNAALDLITEAGIDQVRIAEIARRAGMSSGQVMYYFPSKEHILLETLAWRDHQDIIRTRAALGKATGAWRQLELFIGRYLPASPADPGWILWMEVWARAPHNRQVSQRLEELLRLWRDELAAIVARGVQEGAFAPRPRSITSPSASPRCSTGSRFSASGKCTSRPASGSPTSPWPPPAPSLPGTPPGHPGT